MPPIKKLSVPVNPSVAPNNRRVVTRSSLKPQNDPKRKAGTPPKQEGEHKRQVLVDITNEKKVQVNADNLKNVAGNLKIPNLKLPKQNVLKPQENVCLQFRKFSSTVQNRQSSTATFTSTTTTRCINAVDIKKVASISAVENKKPTINVLENKKQTNTNAVEKKKTVGISAVENKKATVKPARSNVPKVNFPEVKLRTRSSSASSTTSTSSCKSALSRLAIKEEIKNVSGDSEDGELYVTVRESLSDKKSKQKSSQALLQKQCANVCSQERTLPEGVKDYDKENLSNLIEVGAYAMDVFEYLKSREEKYRVDDYLPRQNQVGVSSRAQLVDWLVELQEYFELNHESLYLAVKMLDHYLCKKTVPLTVLQVVGMSCILLAAKYEERFPPSLDDLLFISDYVCTRSQLIKMEQEVLQTLGFELGMPLSYCFLRRYARCIQLSLQDLTLARYILELSLTDYSFMSVSESKMACACLLLALKMLGIGGWTPTLEYYTGYKEADFGCLLPRLNEMLHKEKCSVRHHRVFVKYSDVSFFKVATKKLLNDVTCDNSSS